MWAPANPPPPQRAPCRAGHRRRPSDRLDRQLLSAWCSTRISPQSSIDNSPVLVPHRLDEGSEFSGGRRTGFRRHRSAKTHPALGVRFAMPIRARDDGDVSCYIPLNIPVVASPSTPTIATRSKKMFRCSQLVSGSSRHAWHAARFNPSLPEGPDSEQTGSLEHQRALVTAFRRISAMRSWSASAARPPRLPAASDDAVYTRKPACSSRRRSVPAERPRGNRHRG